ncbi:MAG: sulfotransferase family protein [Actinomycetota bacterium]
MTLRINMWSGPRALSTAMMYAWAQRADTTVVDEPLYAHYLRVSGRAHPGRDEVLAAQEQDGSVVVRDVLLGQFETPVVFFKQMAKHLVGLDRRFLAAGPNVLLTRDPVDMLTSLQVQLPDADLDETGFVELVEILDATLAAGEEPIVVETRALLADPPGVLAALCERVGLAFDDAMLSWPAGPKSADGVWARHWYAGVHASTGWEPYARKDVELLPSLEPVLRAATPLYERLLRHRLG